MGRTGPAGLLGVLAVACLAGAVTWEKDSAPFTFPSSGTRETLPAGKCTGVFGCSLNRRSGAVEFVYSLPPGVRDATVSVCTALGREVARVRVGSGGGRVTWAEPAKRMAGGVYVARLTHGSFEQRLRFVMSK